MSRSFAVVLMAMLAASTRGCRGHAAAAAVKTKSLFPMPRATAKPHAAAAKQHKWPVLGFAQPVAPRLPGQVSRRGEVSWPRTGAQMMMLSPAEARGGAGRLLAGPRFSLSTNGLGSRSAPQRIQRGRWLCEGVVPGRGRGAPVVACHPEGHVGTDLDSEDLAKIVESIDSVDWQSPIASSTSPFVLKAPYAPTGDQPRAIGNIVESLAAGEKYVVLKGATGTGKTFAMAQTISRSGRPSLILCHNKTLATQLARELKGFFPDNAVELFVSYYSYYQPEAYLTAADTYIAKTSVINDELDALRHRATKSLFERDDVIVVASVSCIYGLGLPSNYLDARITVSKGVDLNLKDFAESLQANLYVEQSVAAKDLERGSFTVEHSAFGSEVIVWPPYEESAVRVRFTNGKVTSVRQLLDGFSPTEVQDIVIYPARHHVTPEEEMKRACDDIQAELEKRLAELDAEGETVASKRLQQRTMMDLESMREIGFCQGMENYSRHLAGRAAGEPPETLIHYFTRSFGLDGWLLIIDESHVTVPQLKGMWGADRARKVNLVNHGFRLPSALDNRPLADSEFWEVAPQTLFVSATPGQMELEWSNGKSIDMLIRPTHVLDPEVQVVGTQGQLQHLLKELKSRIESHGDRSLVMTVTKRDAEDLAGWLCTNGVRAKYLHCDLNTVERCEVIQELQEGAIDAIVGVNLLREGLDLPQVSLVAILNADKEGFLRSDRSLTQTIGRAARNPRGLALLYGDRVTGAMSRCIEETERRRAIQHEYNVRHGFEPASTSGGGGVQSLFEIVRGEERGGVEALGRSVQWSRGAVAEAAAANPSTESPGGIGAALSADSESILNGNNKAAGSRRNLGKGEGNGDANSGVYSFLWNKNGRASTLSIDDSIVRMQGGESGVGRVDDLGVDASINGGAIEPEVGSSDNGGELSKNGVGEWWVGSSHVEALRLIASEMPAKTGVYIWRTEPGEGGEVLYVGKAKKLDQRIKSYFSPQATPRHRALVQRARSIEYILTPGGEHDALLLEARLIKLHSPRYNVLLRDDRFYPYICVSTSQRLPRIFSVSRRPRESDVADRYFGPFTDVSLIKRTLASLEEAFGLRQLAFRAKFDQGVDETEYNSVVSQCIAVLEGRGEQVCLDLELQGEDAKARAVRRLIASSSSLESFRLSSELDFLGLDPDTTSADVAAIQLDGARGGVVQLMQLRGGAVRGRFTYAVELPFETHSPMDYSEVLQTTLEEHYSGLSAETEVPDEVITQFKLQEPTAISAILRRLTPKGRKKVSIRGGPSFRGKRAKFDQRMVELASANAGAEAARMRGTVDAAKDGAHDLARLLGLDAPPRRIEAFDISHTLGEGTVASRVVLIDGVPAKHLYRTYNIATVDGIDDYKSMQEVVQRRFARSTSSSSSSSSPGDAADSESNELPDLVVIDGGKGQVSAALRGMAAAGIREGEVPVCGLAKREEEVHVPGQSGPLVTDPDQNGMLLLRAARDESHRFALRSHRRKRSSNIYAS